MPRDPSNHDTEADPLLGPAPGGPPSGGPLRLRCTLIRSDRPVTKVFDRAPDGSVRKRAQANLVDGTVLTVPHDSLADVDRMLDRLGSQNVIVWGVTNRRGRVRLTTERNRADGQISRTRNYFHWPAGPGVLMGDLDPPAHGDFPVEEGAVAAVRGLHPALAAAPALWRPSPSSGVDGAGIRGQRVYIPVLDARLIEQVAPILDDLQWVAGFGRVELGSSGNLLLRGLLDRSVWRPEWLDFAGPPVLNDGIVRDRIDSILVPGSRPFADLSELLTLDVAALHAEAEAARQVAKHALAEEARSLRAEVRKTKPFLNPDPLHGHESLPHDHVLVTREGEEVTVADLLADPKRWHRRAFHDPVEPDYNDDPRIAVAFLDGEPVIYSHAHGGQKYYLRSDPATVFTGIEAEPEPDDGEDPAEADVEPQLIRMRSMRRVMAREALEVHERDLASRTRLFTSVAEALASPTHNTIEAATGIGKTYTLAELAAGELLTGKGRPIIVLCGTSIASIGNFTKEVKGILIDRLAVEHLEIGEDAETAKAAAKKETDELLKRCARVQHDCTVAPLRDRNGDYTYRVILATYATVNRIGDAIDSRGRLLRLLSGMRALEEKHALVCESLPVYGDEADAGLMALANVIALGHRRIVDTDKVTKKTRSRVARMCFSKCETCTLAPCTYASEIRPQGVSQLVISPYRWPDEAAVKLDLKWLPQVIGPKNAEERNYEIHGILTSEIPAIDPMIEETDADGKTVRRLSPEGQIVRWMYQPGATLRRLRPFDRSTERLVDPADIPPNADIQWPRFPCEVWYLVSWDRDALSDLATLCMSTPKLMSASWSAGTLAMVEYAFGPQEHGRVETPEDRKMRHVHVCAVPDTIPPTREDIERLVEHGPVLWVEPTIEKARRFLKIAEAMHSDKVRPALYHEGRYMNVEDYDDGVNLLITYPRSSLARGANLGRCSTVVVHADYYGAMLNELGLGHPDLRAALEEGNQANLLQSIGRPMRADKKNPDDDLKRWVVVRSTTERDGSLTESGRYLIPKMQELAHEATYSQFAVHPRRMLDAQLEFFTEGRVTSDDGLAPGATARTMSGRQRALTKDSREEAKAAKKEALKARKKEEALQMARDGETWGKALSRLNLGKSGLSGEEMNELRHYFIQNVTTVS
ncbi:MAG: hypothetical protein EOM91_17975 [Sphingobacteriia bacterium]|nr:hypothetical protein [Sphingobacteriia bacterium]